MFTIEKLIDLQETRHSLWSSVRVVRTFWIRPHICSYLPVASGRFSKLITSQISFENFSEDGSLLYGEELWMIGVPRSTDLTLLLSIVGVEKTDCILLFFGVRTESDSERLVESNFWEHSKLEGESALSSSARSNFFARSKSYRDGESFFDIGVEVS